MASSKILIVLLVAAAVFGAGFALFAPSASAATGDLVATVNFSSPCASGTGVGIAFDGQNLWYSCYSSNTDLYRADPLTGNVTASYHIVGNLGALAYDAGRNAIWAGWGDGSGTVRLIQLDGSKSVIGTSTAFSAPQAVNFDIDDGLAYDASDDTLYISGDVDANVYHYMSNGTFLGSFPHAPGPSCGNSGLAIGGNLLYEGFDGCSHVYVVDKNVTSVPVFDFSTSQPGDSSFRDEDLECDANTFPGKDVMWSVEAYEPRRAAAFEIPAGSCGTGGQSVGGGQGNAVPEFGAIGAALVLIGGLVIVNAARKQK